jgi:hypothetical protein
MVAQRLYEVLPVAHSGSAVPPLPLLTLPPLLCMHRALEACRVCNVELASLCHRQKGRFLGVGLMPTGHMDDPSVITQVRRPCGYVEESAGTYFHTTRRSTEQHDCRHREG